jgi:hypothetical protein
MSSDKDILGKADGLMRRHAASTDPGEVPMLTELVDLAPKAPAPLPSELAREIFTRVIEEVEGRLASDLERRLLQHLTPQVHAAIASAIGDLHQELANTIGDAVTRALESRNLK